MEYPVRNIEGTDFIVDVRNQELRELADPGNVISFLEMKDHGTHYTFDYDLKEKNLPGFTHNESTTVVLPQMSALDPAGMAEQYAMSIEDVKAKTDFDIIVNQDLVHLRESGALPVIDIAGHPFYADIRIGSLRPKDDFSTMGIRFSEIEDCLLDDGSKYWIPYNPKNHQYVEIDYTTITSIPKDILVVELPNQAKLDPVGYARKHGFDSRDILREYPPVANMKARIVPWKETPIQQIIAKNKRNEIKPAKRKGKKL